MRDVSIACYKAHLSDSSKSSEVFFADALSGIGARGVRVANEIPQINRVFLNDINSTALEFGKKSAKLNSVENKCVFTRSEVCSFLVSRIQNDSERFDLVDLDPFGTPSDFADCLIRAAKDGGLLSLTATDSAVLCGVYPHVALRKYQGLPLRTEYSHEVGMRLLFGLAAQIAMRLEAGILPKFCHHDMHYFRAYLLVKVGNAYSRENESKIGFILHCFKCGHRKTITRDDLFSLRSDRGVSKRDTASVSKDKLQDYLICPSCGSGSIEKGGRLAIGGPLWIGNIQSEEFVLRCREVSKLPVFSPEIDLPLYYDLNAIKLKRGTSMPKINVVAQELQSRGYITSRTRLNPNALRTAAPKDVLTQVVLELAR